MEEKLYIPMDVKPEAEFFKGFGRKQMGQEAIGSAICGSSYGSSCKTLQSL